MTAVGILGILLCFAALPIFMANPSPRRLILFMGLLVVHVTASVVFYQYALTTSADAALYYYDTFGLRRLDLELGTIFTIKLVQTMKSAFGGTYLDYFLIFQATGFWGVLLLQRIFDGVHSELRSTETQLPTWLLFLPGIHFWTAAIGKDAPLFFAICLAIWASMRLRSRVHWLLLGVLVMLLFRPHVALIATVSIAGAIFFGGRSSAVAKIALVPVALAGIWLVSGTVQQSLGVDVSSPGSIGAFLEQQQQRAEWVQGATNLQSSPFVFRLFSLLFRPLFLDASGAFGLLASLENVVFIFVVGVMVRNWRLGAQLFRSALPLRFALFFAGMLTFLLALTYYNVGLGVRQKMMIVPGLFTFFVAQWAVLAAQRRRDEETRRVRSTGFSMVSDAAADGAAASGNPHLLKEQ